MKWNPGIKSFRNSDKFSISYVSKMKSIVEDFQRLIPYYKKSTQGLNQHQREKVTSISTHVN